MSDDLTPILVGCGQYTLKKQNPGTPESILDIIELACRSAAEDSGIGTDLWSKVDAVYSVNSISAVGSDLPVVMSARLGAKPSKLINTTIGGNTPQWLVNLTADEISKGNIETVLLCGGELLKTAKGGARLEDLVAPDSSASQSTLIGDTRSGTNPHEVAHGLAMPVDVYPLFENALRHHYGQSIAEHQQNIGKLYQRFSEVAANNPYSWFKEPMSAEAICEVTDSNRYIGFPYTKFMNSMISVNQAAAVVLTSVANAKRLGIDPSRWVYIHGIADANDHYYPSERVNYYSSPAIKTAGEEALAMADIGINDVDFIDFYSCFPSAVQIARDALGMKVDDPRDLTVTGGLRFFGGPGNNYPMHSIATVMDMVRNKPGSFGLTTGLGWHITKHSIGIYSNEPVTKSWQRKDPAIYQSKVDTMPKPAFTESPQGRAEVETYTVLFDHQNNPTKGIIVGRLEDQTRFLANTSSDQDTLQAMINNETIGSTGKVSTKDNLNTFVFE